jgi:hypothetical protein
MEEVFKQNPILEKTTAGMIDCCNLLLHWFNVSANHFIGLARCTLFDIGGVPSELQIQTGLPCLPPCRTGLPLEDNSHCIRWH